MCSLQLNVTISEIQSLATNGKVYSEGKAYASDSYVSRLAFDPADRCLTAKVLSMDHVTQYNIQIWLNLRERPRKVSCTCAASTKYIGCCKHQVAVLIYALNMRLDRLPLMADLPRNSTQPSANSASIGVVSDTAASKRSGSGTSGDNNSGFVGADKTPLAALTSPTQSTTEGRQQLPRHRQTLEMMRRLQTVLAIDRGAVYQHNPFATEDDPDAAEGDRLKRGLLRQLDLKMTLQLPQYSSEMATLEAKIGFQGESRYYKVKSFDELIDAIDSGKSLVFGKELTLHPDRQYFNRASQAVLDWLLFQHHNQLEKTTFQYQPVSSLFRKNQVILNAARLYQFIELYADEANELDLTIDPYNNQSISPVIRHGWPEVSFALRAWPKAERYDGDARVTTGGHLPRIPKALNFDNPTASEDLDILELLMVCAGDDRNLSVQEEDETEPLPLETEENKADEHTTDQKVADNVAESDEDEEYEDVVIISEPKRNQAVAKEVVVLRRDNLSPVRAYAANSYKRSGREVPLRLLTRDASLILFDQQLWLTPPKERAIAALYRSLAQSEDSRLLLGAEEAGVFMSQMLPLLEGQGHIILAQEVLNALLREPLEASLWLDKEGNGISAKLEFRYGGYVVDPHPASKSRPIYRPADSDQETAEAAEPTHQWRWQLRDENAELKILDYLQLAGFQDHQPAKVKAARKVGFLASLSSSLEAPVEEKSVKPKQEEPKLFYLFGDMKLYTFLAAVLPQLQDLTRIYYSDRFQNLRIRRLESISMSASLRSNTDLLAIEIDGLDYSPEDLARILSAYREKRRYVRLRDGEFLTLDADFSDPTLDILAEADSWGGTWDEKTLFLPKYRAVPLQQLLAEENGANVDIDDNLTLLAENLKEPSRLQFTVPDTLQATLRPYQIAGFQWLCLMDYYGFGGILADDMGLGKTLQALTYILHKKEERAAAGRTAQPTLVVAPTSLIYNWQDEARKFAPSLKVLVIEGAKDSRIDAISSLEDIDIAILSYTVMRQDIPELQATNFSACFLDEAQYIKNPRTLTAKAVKKIQADRNFALTGTPIENSLSELWSIFDYLMPGYLFSLNQFHESFEVPIAKAEGAHSNASDELRKLVRPFLLRRMKKNVLQELPDKIESIMRCDMTAEQQKVYHAYIAQARDTFEEMVDQRGYERSQIQILALLTRLRQIACHPQLFLQNYEGGSGKLDALEEHLENLLSSSHRVLLFSQFTSMLDIIRKQQEAAGRKIFYIDGQVPARERLDQVDRFNSGEGELFLISLKAGGTGLNLTGADTVIHYDPWWNPAVEQQATDRAHRIGQREVVQIFRMVSRGTIEEKIIELQEQKSLLVDQVISPGDNFLKQMNLGEIRNLLSYEV